MGNRMAWATVFGAFLAAFFNTGLGFCMFAAFSLFVSSVRAARRTLTLTRARARAHTCEYTHTRVHDARPHTWTPDAFHTLHLHLCFVM
jgi:hypothetical protein